MSTKSVHPSSPSIQPIHPAQPSIPSIDNGMKHKHKQTQCMNEFYIYDTLALNPPSIILLPITYCFICIAVGSDFFGFKCLKKKKKSTLFSCRCHCCSIPFTFYLVRNVCNDNDAFGLLCYTLSMLWVREILIRLPESNKTMTKNCV